MIAHDQIAARALQAAVAVARRLGLDCGDARLLHHSEHISLALFPSPVVARVRPWTRDADAGARRELAVARHLVGKGAPAVGPVTEVSAGPHLQDGLAVTLWRFVEHVPADADNPDHIAAAAVALRRIHDALHDVPVELPSFMSLIGRALAALHDEQALPALASADRAFLRQLADRLVAVIRDHRARFVPIHGDTGLHNVFVTLDGALYGDFEAVCRGPREWDIGFLGDADLAPFEPIDCELYAHLSDVRSVCVAAWCWAKYEMPEKRAAADYHLGYLRERFG
jgi:hypothetical protein